MRRKRFTYVLNKGINTYTHKEEKTNKRANKQKIIISEACAHKVHQRTNQYSVIFKEL